MYSADQIQHLQKQTASLLSLVKQHPPEKERLEELRDVLRFHEYRYAILNDPLISDFEYDILYKALEKVETEHPELATPDSPTTRVASGLTREFPTVQHLVPMLSLENSYNEDDLVAWDLHPDKIVTDVFPLSRAAEAYALMATGKCGKVVIEP